MKNNIIKFIIGIIIILASCLIAPAYLNPLLSSMVVWGLTTLYCIIVTNNR